MAEPMLQRIANGRTDLVFDYVAQGHPASATDEDGTLLIRWCAYYGDVSAIRFLLANGETLPSLGENLDLNGACFHGHWRLAQFLIEKGADVNHPLPETGEVPLHAATSKRRPAYTAVIRVLLANGANPSAVTIPGVETGSFMRDCRTKGETPLHRAAAFCTEEAIDLLLAAGAPRDARDAAGDTPLSWASWYQRPVTILAKLCHGDYRIRKKAVERAETDSVTGWEDRMEMHLLGDPTA